MSPEKRDQIQAAAFRGLIDHLQKRTEVQNIDLMNLAGFCRNCLAKYLVAAAQHHGEEMSYDQAREAVYGEPYDDWKAKHQLPASDAQKAAYGKSAAGHADIRGDL